MQPTLYYAHDPMCSWCWAYRPIWERIRGQLSLDLDVVPLLGGLAPDSQEPMPQVMRDKLQDIWRQIQTRVPGTRFNFEFWAECDPRRSTYPACRAVIAASTQDPGQYENMVHAIQQAYYLNARNPSENDTLIQLAMEVGLDGGKFAHDLVSAKTDAEFRRQLAFCRHIGIFGFPGLVLQHAGRVRQIQVLMNDADSQLDLIRSAIIPA